MSAILDELGNAVLDEAGEEILDMAIQQPPAMLAGRVQYIDHQTAAPLRFLQQYKESQRLKGLADALFGRQMRDLELAAYQLYGRLDIDGSAGALLDAIGGIVGLERTGWADPLYRILLKAKIGQNTSYGRIEDVIGVWRLLAQANRVQVVETYPAQIDLYSDTPIDGAITGFVRKLMRKVVAAGVKVEFLAIIFSPVNAFGTDGDDTTVNGFGDYYDTEVGGELAYIQLS